VKPIATTTTTTMKLILMFAVMGLISLQLLSLLGKDDSSNNNNSNNYHAFAVTNGQPISQKLNYAHFLPLTNNTKLHQVKIIVDYAPISAAQNAIMKVYAPNGTLIKISSFPNGLKTTATGKAQFATSFSDNTIKNVIASIMFTDSSKSANFSNPVNVKLNLGQTIPPS
jgi:hypothetical protein